MECQCLPFSGLRPQGRSAGSPPPPPPPTPTKDPPNAHRQEPATGGGGEVCDFSKFRNVPQSFHTSFLPVPLACACPPCVPVPLACLSPLRACPPCVPVPLACLSVPFVAPSRSVAPSGFGMFGHGSAILPQFFAIGIDAP